jgi:hypothetical protein
MRWLAFISVALWGCAPSAARAPDGESGPSWLKLSDGGRAPQRIVSCDAFASRAALPCLSQPCAVTRRTQLPFRGVQDGALALDGERFWVHLDMKGERLLLEKLAQGWKVGPGIPGDVAIQPYGDGRLLAGHRYLLGDDIELAPQQLIPAVEGDHPEPGARFVPGRDGRCAFYLSGTAVVDGAVARRSAERISIGHIGRPGIDIQAFAASGPLLGAAGPRFAWVQSGRVLEARSEGDDWNVRVAVPGNDAWTQPSSSLLATSQRVEALRYVYGEGGAPVLVGIDHRARQLKKCQGLSCGTERSWTHDALWLATGERVVRIALDQDEEQHYRVLDALAAKDGTLWVLAAPGPHASLDHTAELLEIRPGARSGVVDEVAVQVVAPPPPVRTVSAAELRSRGFMHGGQLGAFGPDGVVLAGHDRWLLGPTFLDHAGLEPDGSFVEVDVALPASLACAGTKVLITFQRRSLAVTASLSRLGLSLRGQRSEQWSPPEGVDTMRRVAYRLELRGQRARLVIDGRALGVVPMQESTSPDELAIGVDGQGPAGCKVLLSRIHYGNEPQQLATP